MEMKASAWCSPPEGTVSSPEPGLGSLRQLASSRMLVNGFPPRFPCAHLALPTPVSSMPGHPRMPTGGPKPQSPRPPRPP